MDKRELESLNRKMKKELQHLSFYDLLTELPNKALLMKHVEKAILQAIKHKKLFTFLFLNLDQFKLINNSLGHSIGDKLLQLVASRLLVVTDKNMMVAHYSADEFIIIFPNLHDIKSAERLVQNVLFIFNQAFKIEHFSLNITASIGISIYPHHGTNFESLIKHADTALLYAKESGGNTFRFYEPEMNHQTINYMQLDHALHHALQAQEFHLVYQPLINIKENSIDGVEALIRWHSPIFGEISPLKFIPIAEKNGLIIEIGEWVLEEACAQLQRWHAQGYNKLHMSVNFSSRQLQHTGLPALIKKNLSKTGLSAKWLEIELTESLLVENINNLVQIMNELKTIGINISIDDFGTGFSNLSYLKKLPIDRLKIDQSFVKMIVENKNSSTIVKSIIALANALDLEVLAEGIETESQKDFIQKNGCGFGQGYYFSMPDRPDRITQYLANYPKN